MSIEITLDGISGSGKGTIASCLKDYLVAKGIYAVLLEDRNLDPLRDSVAKVVDWCSRHNLNKHKMTLPLFACGATFSDAEIAKIMKPNQIVIRDRSFITSLAYVPASTDLTRDQIWDLYVNCMGVIVPQVAVIVDADPDEAMQRVRNRKDHVDKGAGGKMSGDLAHVYKIRAKFLDLPDFLVSKGVSSLLVKNRGLFSNDQNVVFARIEDMVDQITGFLRLENFV